ncbi:DUF2160 domain-containing protein [Massilia sp. W12]|uniref:DUF2160 domain-containing protein n=1 Tax=Massilia sp. W12 TaxID=3126507 RepID=UPI0030D5382B
MEWLAWMSWTREIAIFFGCIIVMLIVMTIWEIRSPCVARKGFLPLVTTRGDRLFIGLLSCAYVNLLWVALTDMSQWIAASIGLALMVLIMAKA